MLLLALLMISFLVPNQLSLVRITCLVVVGRRVRYNATQQRDVMDGLYGSLLLPRYFVFEIAQKGKGAP